MVQLSETDLLRDSSGKERAKKENCGYNCGGDRLAKFCSKINTNTSHTGWTIIFALDIYEIINSLTITHLRVTGVIDFAKANVLTRYHII